MVEAAIVKLVSEPQDDPAFLSALSLVAHAVKEQLSPPALRWLEATLASDERAGMVRWGELTRLQLWLHQVKLPVMGPGARRLKGSVKWTSAYQMRLDQMTTHPERLFQLAGISVPGKVGAAIYSIAKRAQVSPAAVGTALMYYGLERLAESIRATRAAPPARDDVPTVPNG